MRLYDFIYGEYKSRKRKIRVGFFGMGRANEALFGTLPTELVSITLRDENAVPDKYKGYGAKILAGEDAFSAALEDVMFFSPSTRRDREELKDFFNPEGLVLSDCELFFRDGYKDVYAISGSDGKSTTTYLTSELLTKSGIRATPSGNYGLPYCLLNEDSGVPVCELSSFNLQYASPLVRRALVTNVTPNHLNWHKDFEEYKETKLKLIRGASEPVICADDKILLGECAGSGVFGAYSARLGQKELRASIKAEVYVSVENGAVHLNGERLFECCEMLRPERYILLNMLGAVAITAGTAKKDAIKSVARGFGGLEHRSELVARQDGISYINSSIDTSPARTVATLGEISRPVRIILGGRDKGLPKEALLDALAGKVTKISLYSEAREEFERALGADPRFSDIPRESFDKLSGAIDFLLKEPRTGECVLLSPAATAYGEFKSFEERGKFFKKYIRDRLSKS